MPTHLDTVYPTAAVQGSWAAALLRHSGETKVGETEEGETEVEEETEVGEMEVEEETEVGEMEVGEMEVGEMEVEEETEVGEMEVEEETEVEERNCPREGQESTERKLRTVEEPETPVVRTAERSEMTPAKEALLPPQAEAPLASPVVDQPAWRVVCQCP